MRARRASVFAASVAFAYAVLVIATVAWSGAGSYRSMAKANGVSGSEFIDQTHPNGPQTWVDLNGLSVWHAKWSAYVEGRASSPPTAPDGSPYFLPAELAHMKDVRGVLVKAEIGIPMAVAALAWLIYRANKDGKESLLRFLRSVGIGSGLAVLVFGAMTAAAFPFIFRTFHAVLFPQGNFAFDPASSNLIRLYPDWYWEGMATRIVGTFIAAAVALAGVSWWRLQVLSKATRTTDASSGAANGEEHHS